MRGPSWAHRLAAVTGVVVLHLAILFHRVPVSQRPAVPLRPSSTRPLVVDVTVGTGDTHVVRSMPRKAALSTAAPLPRAQAMQVSSLSFGSVAEAPAESPQPADAAPAITPVVATPAETGPDYANNPAPPYPPASRRWHEQGRVVLSVLVGADGTVTDAIVEISSGHSRLDQAALEAVRRWRFVPGTRGGAATSMRVRIPVEFVLSQ